MRAQRRLKRGFNFLAPVYDFGSRLLFGERLFQIQTFFLPLLKKHHNVLILGGGTGRFLLAFARENPEAHICYTDMSERMISLSHQLLAEQMPEALTRVEFICGDLSHLHTGKKFDLVVTPFVLDCFPPADLSAAMDQLNNLLIPGGKWLFADFHIPDRGFSKILARVVIGGLYTIFNLVCGLGIWVLPDFRHEFNRLGYRAEAHTETAKGMLAATIYSRQE